MPRFNPSYVKRKTRKRSREDDEDNLGPFIEEISSIRYINEREEVTQPFTEEISSEEEEEVTQPLTTSEEEKEKGEGKLSSEESKDVIEDCYHLPLDLLVDVSCIMCNENRIPRLKENEEWKKYMESTRFYQKTLELLADGKCQTLKSYISVEKDTESTQSLLSSEEELMRNKGSQPRAKKVLTGFCRPVVKLPVKFGKYSPRTAPRRIPYHLYLLVKEAVDIMTTFPDWGNNKNHERKLELVERKIRFFCTYLHCHLPKRWKYNRKTAKQVVSRYDRERKPKYNMDGYTPITRFDDYNSAEFDRATKLSRDCMLLVMKIIHSRKTPQYWTMTPPILAFYCKLCSCFGIDYAHLEAASEDDVCLMDVGSFNVFGGCYI